MNWTGDEKQKMADWINQHYLCNQNFGSVSKADFELFIFSMFLDHLIDTGQNYDDYTIGKQLGMTISRVRSLKERKELKYHRADYYWVNAFTQCIKDAKYDEVTRLVKVNIPEVNVIKDVRYFLEKKGWYSEYQLNPKLFQCRADVFLDLCLCLPDENNNTEFYSLTEEEKSKLKEIKKQCRNDKEGGAIENILKGAVNDGLKELALYATKDVLCAALSAIPFGGVVQPVISYLVKALKEA